MNITKFFIEKSTITITLILTLIIGGLISYIHLPRDEDPGFFIRTAVVTTYFDSADANKVDQLVTHNLEEEIRQMGEVEHIRSRSRDGVSIIYVDVYDKYKDLQPIWDKLRRRVDKAKSDLPKEIKGPYVDDEFGDVFGSIITISANDFSYYELDSIASTIKNYLLSKSEIAKVEVLGDQDERIYLEYDNSSLQRYGLSPYKLGGLLSDINIIAPGGSVLVDNKRLMIEPTGDFTNLEDLAKSPLTTQNGAQLYIRDILKVKRGYVDPPSTLVRSNGKRALSIAISMKDEGNILLLGEQVKESVKYLNSTLPIGTKLDIVAFQPDYVKALTDKFINSLIQSIIIVFVLILVILGVQTGLIVGSIIPLTVLATFLFMNIFHIGLDKISLSALIISLGILVDNSIVVSESIIVHLQKGHTMIDSIYKSTNEYKRPLLFSSLATICAFLPIFTAKSQVSEYTSSLFSVMAISLLCSWFLSITVLPFLCLKFLKTDKLPDENNFKIKRYYKPYIRKALNKPYKTILGVGALLFVSLFLFASLPKLFFPDSDRNMFEIELNFPVLTDIKETSKVTHKVEQYLIDNFMNKKTKNQIMNFSSYIGESAPRYVLSATPETPVSYYSMILVNADSYKIIDELILKIQKYCDENFVNLNAIVRKVPLGPPYDAPVEIRVSGYNRDSLFINVNKIKEKLKTIHNVTLIEDDWGPRAAKVQVKIKTDLASRLNITNSDIASSLHSAFGGDEVSVYREKTDLIPIIYRFESPFNDDLNSIETLNVYSSLNGNFAPLGQLADIKLEWEYPKIYRRDGKLTVTIQAQIDKRKTTADKVIKKITPWLKHQQSQWKLGYEYQIGGTVEASKKGNKSITDQLPMAFGFILFLLIYHFNSFKKTAIVLISSPLSLLGSNIGLFITRSYFGFMTFLGYISLIGIVTNNGVVLINAIENEQKKENCLTLKQKIARAAISRFRPVLLTAITTIGGMLPLWLGQDPMFSSMAIAIIFGLLASIFLTLLFTPVLYLLFFEKQIKQ